ncbi:hypothetical protein NECID01_0363 [Nematocida sp. AWRm77]|nr:hypothetical protein NECID01_0363 [Nematocida sp. AWRm77]
MQAEQAQTMRINSRKSNKKLYLYTGLGTFIALLVAYIAGTIKYKFLDVDPQVMGTKFYSWRVNGGDAAMFKEKIGKFPEGKLNVENTTFLKEYLSDKYSEHMPRDIGNYMTLSFPNMDFVLFLRKHTVTNDKNYVKPKKALAEGEQAEEPTETEKKVEAYLKVNNTPMFLEKAEEKKIHSAIKKAHAEAESRGEAFKASMIAAIDFFTALATKSKSDNFLFKGTEVQAEGVEELKKLLDSMNDGEQQERIAEFLTGSLSADHKKFLEKKGLTASKDITEDLSKAFFEELKYGTFSPYFSFAYSRVAYMIYFITLDAELGTLPEGAEDDLKISQDFYRKRTLLIGELMSYAIAKNMSETLGEDVVKSKGNFVYNLLFLPKLSSPNTEKLDADLETLVSTLEKRKEYIKSL